MGEKPMLFDPKTPMVWSHKYRKRRKHEGEAIDEHVKDVNDITHLESAKRAGQKYCKNCHKFRDWSDISFGYDIIQGKLRAMLFICKKCNTVIGEKEIK